MPDRERKLLPEVIALLENEPTLQVLVVEGNGDKNLYSWFIANFATPSSPSKKVWVHEIDDFSVETSVVKKSGFDVGARGRLLAAALMAVQPECGKTIDGLKFIADLDYGFPRDLPASVFSTDYHSAENYSANPRVLEKFISCGLGGCSVDAASLMSLIKEPLRKMFAARKTLLDRHQGVTPARIKKCLSVAKEQIGFDAERWIENSLSAAGLAGDLADTIALFHTTYDGLPPELNRSCRGHDVSIVIAKYFKTYKPIDNDALGDPAAVEVALRSSMCDEFLQHEPLFATLKLEYADSAVESSGLNSF